MSTVADDNWGPIGRVATNTASLLTSDVLNKATTFVIYVLVARYSGPRSFGQLSLGLLLLYTFQVFACMGLPTLVTREVAKRRSWSGRYFASASIIAACASLLSFAALTLLVFLSRYPRDTSEVILILGIGILPWSLTTITEALFRGWEQMHVLVLAAIPSNLLRIFLSFYLLANQHDIRSVAVVLLACHFTTLSLEWALLVRRLGFRRVKTNLAFCLALLGRTWKFLGICKKDNPPAQGWVKRQK